MLAKWHLRVLQVRLLTCPRSSLTTTRRMLRHVADRAHRDSSERSAAICLRIQATNATTPGPRVPRVTSRCSSVIFAPQTLNQNRFCKFAWMSPISEYRRPDWCTPKHVRDVCGKMVLIRSRMKAHFELFSPYVTVNIFNVTFSPEVLRWSHMFGRQWAAYV